MRRSRHVPASRPISPLPARGNSVRSKECWQESFDGRPAVGPLVAVDPDNLPPSADHPWVAIKDPSIMRFQSRWHLFCSLRRQKSGQGRIRIGYLSFADWKDAAKAKWHLLELSKDYHGAPQVFFLAHTRSGTSSIN